jgi:hypothetical protein
MPPRLITAIIIIICIVVAARLYFVETFAVPLPYWDQWDAEGDFLLRPWIEGRLRLQELWQPHNEHRIFSTRLLSLLIFSITGKWNNLLEARVNVLVAACIPAMLLLFLVRQRALSGLRWLVVIAIIAQFALPFSFENMLVGFQSQFYFLIIFTIGALMLAACYPENGRAIAAILILCLLSIVTMASGLLTPVAVSGIYLLHAFTEKRIGRMRAAMVVALLIMAAGGYLILPQIGGHQMYRAESVSDVVNAIGYILSWPFLQNKQPAFVLWLPAVIAVPVLWFSGKFMRADMVMAGCVMWSLLQAVAIAYGRGHELTEVASRYTELFSPGLIGQAWFAARLMERSLMGWVMVVFFWVYVKGHIRHNSNDMYDIRRNHRLSLLQEKNVRLYLKTKDPKYLDQPKFEIPYPEPVRLRSLLDNPVILGILPVQLDEAQVTE